MLWARTQALPAAWTLFPTKKCTARCVHCQGHGQQSAAPFLLDCPSLISARLCCGTPETQWDLACAVAKRPRGICDSLGRAGMFVTIGVGEVQQKETVSNGSVEDSGGGDDGLQSGMYNLFRLLQWERSGCDTHDEGDQVYYDMAADAMAQDEAGSDANGEACVDAASELPYPMVFGALGPCSRYTSVFAMALPEIRDARSASGRFDHSRESAGRCPTLPRYFGITCCRFILIGLAECRDVAVKGLGLDTSTSWWRCALGPLGDLIFDTQRI